MLIASPILVFAGLIVVFLFFLLLKKPELGILLVIVLTSTIFSTDANPGVSIGIGHIYLSDILLIFLLGYVVVRSLADPGFKLIGTPLNIPLLAFVFLAFLSTFIAIFQSRLTIQQSLGEARDIANYLLFFAAINLLRNEKQIRFVMRGFIVLATFVSLAMIAQYILGSSFRLLPGRVEELYTEGVYYNGVTRIIPPGYSLVFVGFILLSVVIPYNKFKLQQIWLLVPWLLTGIGVLLTFKRHFWVASIVIFMLIAYLSRRRELNRVLSWALLVSVIVIAGVFFTLSATGSKGLDLLNSSVSRLTSLLDSGTYEDPNSSLRWRDFEYQYSLPQIISHPLLGLGLGARYRPFIPHRDYVGFYDGRSFIHNGYLYLMVKTGLLGFFAMLCVIGIFVVHGLSTWEKLRTSESRAMVLGCTLAFIGMLMGTIVEPMIIEWRWTAILAVLMGLQEAMIRLNGINGTPGLETRR